MITRLTGFEPNGVLRDRNGVIRDGAGVIRPGEPVPVPAGDIIQAALSAATFSSHNEYGALTDTNGNPVRNGGTVVNRVNMGTGATDATQATALNQPFFRRVSNYHDYGSYLYGSGVAGNGIEVPFAAGTYDFEITFTDASTTTGTVGESGGVLTFEQAGEIAQIEVSQAAVVSARFIAANATDNAATFTDTFAKVWTVTETGTHVSEIFNLPVGAQTGYLYSPGTAGNGIEVPAVAGVHDYELTYFDGTTTTGTVTQSAGVLTFGPTGTDFDLKSITQIEVSQSSTVSARFIAAGAGHHAATYTDSFAKVWTVNSTSELGARVTQFSEIEHDGSGTKHSATFDSKTVGTMIHATNKGILNATVTATGAETVGPMGIAVGTTGSQAESLITYGSFQFTGTYEAGADLVSALDNQGAKESFVEVEDWSFAFFSSNITGAFPLIEMGGARILLSMFQSSRELTAIPLLNTANVTSMYRAFYGTRGLVEIAPINISNVTTFFQCFYDARTLVNFPANFFDTWTAVPGNNCLGDTWEACSALSSDSVENILNSIATSGQNAPGTGPNIGIDYNAASGTPDITAAVATLKGRSPAWTITLNGVLQ